MTKHWQKKYQREIEKRISYPCATDWAVSLAKVVHWYSDRHPEAETDHGEAIKAMMYLRPTYGARYSPEKVSIDRDKKGFKLKVWHMGAGYEYLHVTTRGLPPVPTTYEEHSA
jgi:cation transport regulator ChaC